MIKWIYTNKNIRHWIVRKIGQDLIDREISKAVRKNESHWEKIILDPKQLELKQGMVKTMIMFNKNMEKFIFGSSKSKLKGLEEFVK